MGGGGGGGGAGTRQKCAEKGVGEGRKIGRG